MAVRGYRLIAAIVVLLFLAPTARAQQEDPAWSPPLRIGQLTLFPSNPAPAIVADPAGWLHVFWIDRRTEAGSGVIMYTCWNGTTWSRPLDVLLSPEYGNEAWLAQAEVTPDGRLHVVWTGHSGTLYHSWAPAHAAASAQAWSAPKGIGDMPGTGQYLLTDARGRLHMIFLDRETESPYYVRSDDGGDSWTRAVRIASFSQLEIPGMGYNISTMAIDGRNRIHVAWRRGATDTDYYSRSEDDGASWAPPQEFEYPADATNRLQNSPTLAAVGNDTIHLVWLAVYYLREDGQLQANSRYHRWSADGGVTWTPMAHILPDLMGHNGPNSLVVDSAGELHQITVGGAGTGAIHWVEYTRWLGNAWAPYTVIPGTRRADWGAEGPSWSDMALSEGNWLHVVWETRDGDIWYSTRQVSAPQIAAAAWPGPQPQITDVPKPSLTSLAAASPTLPPPAPRFAERAEPGGGAAGGAISPIAAGLLAVLAMLVMVAVLNRRQRRA